jgi:hypothetical protein
MRLHTLTPLLRRIVLPCLIVALATVISQPGQAAGIYVDAAGGRHAWKVNDAHALLWEEKPYLPVGLVVPALSLAAEASPAQWEVDRAALERVRGAGVSDVLIRAPVPLTAAPTAAVQRLVDALEGMGLRYGVAVEARPSAPMDGYAIDPVQVPVAPKEISPGANSRWDVKLPGAHHAVWVLVDQAEGVPILGGRVAVQDGTATITASFRPARRIFAPGPAWLIVVPQRGLETADPAGLLNLWTGFADFQAGLVAHLKSVHWGPGLRFMVNPLPRDLGLGSQGDEAVPASEEFVREFREWLSRRYSVNDILTGWAFNDRAVESLDIAARLVPMWRRQSPATQAWFVDPEGKQIYRVDPRRSHFWADLAQFRGDSARIAVSKLAEAIKAGAADVPVVYEWTHYHSVYTQPQGNQGADGMGLVARGRSESLLTEQAGPFAAQCEEAPRDCWALATTWRAAAVTAMDAVIPPRSPEDALQQLRSLGLKGLFIEREEQSEAGDPIIGTVLSRARAWMAESSAAGYRPAVCYFPAQFPSGAAVRQLAPDVWWLPSTSAGQPLFLGDTVRGYHITGPISNQAPHLADATVVWSAQGPQKTTFVVPKDVIVDLYDASGHPLKQRIRGPKISLALDETPVIVKGVRPGMVFPVEAASEALAELAALIQRAEAQRIDATALASFKLSLRNAQSIFTPATAVTVYDLVRQPVQVLREALSPYIWLEGERPAEHNFTGVAPDRQASDGAFLLLSRTRPPEGGAYRARYAFNVGTDGLYDLWISAAAPDGLGSTGLQWQLDDDPPAAAGAPATAGKPYGPALSWSRLAQVRLRPGKHTLTLLVPARSGRAAERYSLSLDAIVLAREPFVPEGGNRPTWRPRGKS